VVEIARPGHRQNRTEDLFLENSRVRFDIQLAGSLGFTPSFVFGGPTLELRVGAQLSERFAVYYQPQGTYGFAAVTLFNSLMAEMHVHPLRVALGPSVDYVVAWCGDTLGTTRNGPYFGGVARLAVDLRPRHSAGSGLSLGLDAHPVLYQGGALMFLMVPLPALGAPLRVRRTSASARAS